MKMIFVFLSAAVFMMVNTAFAQNQIFELEEMSNYTYPIYPKLDLTNIDKIKIVVSNDSDPLNRDLIKTELHFPKANNLIVTNFKRIDNKYRAIVKNAWIYNHVIVDVIPDHELSVFNTVRIKIYVGENQSLINSSTTVPGEIMYESAGILRDKTPNALADSTSIIYQDKRAFIKLYQKESSNERGTEHGHLVKVNHLGNGEFSKFIPIDRHATAIAFLTSEIDEMTFYQIRYKDNMGNINETSPEIINQLFEAF